VGYLLMMTAVLSPTWNLSQERNSSSGMWQTLVLLAGIGMWELHKLWIGPVSWRNQLVLFAIDLPALIMIGYAQYPGIKGRLTEERARSAALKY
jgi:hypothetical protein